MKTSKLIVLLTVLLISDLIFASFGPEVSKYDGKELKWIDEPVNYFVMFKSNLDANYNCIENPEENSFELKNYIPNDDLIVRAFLIWTGTIHKDKIALPPDNEVQLHFNSTYGEINHSATITADPGIITKPRGFEFNSIKQSGFDSSYYVYRVDVTDFFNTILEKGADAVSLDHDDPLSGKYFVTGINCFKDKAHPEATLSDWSIIIVYYSKHLSGKNIYIYDNFQLLKNEYLESELTGFDTGYDPEAKMTFINHLGNHGIPSVPNIDSGERVSEGIWVQGTDTEWYSLDDRCNIFTAATNNFETLDYIDIFNSTSSVLYWSFKNPSSNCIGEETPDIDDQMEKNIEADTFIMNAKHNIPRGARLSPHATEIHFKYGVNMDNILTDLVIVSTDQKKPPSLYYYPGQELAVCAPCAEKGDYWCESDLEYTFVIRLKNYGERTAEDISIKTTIPEYMEYVKNSTEFSNAMYPTYPTNGDKYLYSNKWTSIPDGKDGEFPLKEDPIVLERLSPDNTNDMVQPELALFVRYRTKLKDGGRIKSMVIESRAEIGIKGSSKMYTNSGVPLKLRFSDNSLSNQEDIDMTECGTAKTETPDEDDDADSTQDTELTDDSNNKSSGCNCIFL